MPFNHLLFDALLPGKTLAEDRGHGGYTSARLDPGGDETVLLFRLDSETTRRRLSLTGKSCCDHFYLFRGRHTSLLILVELKGDNLERAEEQLSNAIDSICLRSDSPSSWRKLVRAVIVSPAVSPRDRLKIQKRMAARGIQVFFGTSRQNYPCVIKNVSGLSEEFKTS
jgi:hypothetical protein